MADARALVWRGTPAVFTVWPVEAKSEEDRYLLRLGASIKLIRKRLLGLSQDALGDRVKRDRNTVSRWENGKTSLSAYDLAQLWEALGVPGEWLLNPTDSVTELDLRIAQLRGVAAAAARDETGEGPDRPSGDGKGPQRGRPQA